MSDEAKPTNDRLTVSVGDNDMLERDALTLRVERYGDHVYSSHSLNIQFKLCVMTNMAHSSQSAECETQTCQSPHSVFD